MEPSKRRRCGGAGRPHGQASRHERSTAGADPSSAHVGEFDADRSDPRSANPFRMMHKLGERFVVLYSGNLGAAHDFGTLLDAAKGLKDRSDIVFLIAGGGPRLAWVQKQVEERHLTNVRFLPYQPREMLRYSLSAGDVHLVTLRPGFQGLLVPSKFIGALASGRPLLFVGPNEGEIPDAIRVGGCGFIVEPGDATALSEAIVALQADDAKRQEWDPGRGSFSSRITLARKWRRNFAGYSEKCTIMPDKSGGTPG